MRVYAMDFAGALPVGARKFRLERRQSLVGSRLTAVGTHR